jgi:hypothetical protein
MQMLMPVPNRTKKPLRIEAAFVVGSLELLLNKLVIKVINDSP